MPEGVTGNMYTRYFLNRKSGTEANPIGYVSKLIVFVLQKFVLSRQSQLELSFYNTSFGSSNPRYFSPSLPGPNAYLLLGALSNTKFSLLLL